MNVLSIDFTSKMAGVAVLSGGRCVASLTSEKLRETRASIASQGEESPRLVGPSSLFTPLIEETISQSGLKMSDFRLIALSIGPGLFTGLRVGVVTAKTLAYATQADVIGVNTLEVSAAKAYAQNGSHTGPVRVAINAQRQQLFAGRYRSVGPWQVDQMEENKIVDQLAWPKTWQEGDLVSGAGLKMILPTIQSDSQYEFAGKIADQATWGCDAVSVGKVAIAHHDNGRRDDHWKLKPLYFRPSAAEEVRMARAKANE